MVHQIDHLESHSTRGALSRVGAEKDWTLCARMAVLDIFRRSAPLQRVPGQLLAKYCSPNGLTQEPFPSRGSSPSEGRESLVLERQNSGAGHFLPECTFAASAWSILAKCRSPNGPPKELSHSGGSFPSERQQRGNFFTFPKIHTRTILAVF